MASATAPARPRGRPPRDHGWQNQIPPDLFDSAVYLSLSALQRLLLVTMIAKADRHGRGLAIPSKLRSAAFDGLPVSDEEAARLVDELPDLLRGSVYEIRCYEVDRNPYWCFTRWLEWQNIDYLPQTSRFPTPPDDDSEPPSTPPKPDGSADLPPARSSSAAGVPTSGAKDATGEAQEQGGATQEGADPSATAQTRQAAIEQARRSPEYREFEEVCREAHLDTWITFTSFELLYCEAITKRRDWRILIEVAKEAIRSASGKPPNVNYGLRILREMPPAIKTRERAEEHFAEERERRARARGGDSQPGSAGGKAGRAKRSNVILRRDPEERKQVEDDPRYDHIYKRFDDKPPPEAPEVN